jgi:hypothetical protein
MDESIRASHRTLSTPVTNPGLHEPAGQTVKPSKPAQSYWRNALLALRRQQRDALEPPGKR